MQVYSSLNLNNNQINNGIVNTLTNNTGSVTLSPSDNGSEYILNYSIGPTTVTLPDSTGINTGWSIIIYNYNWNTAILNVTNPADTIFSPYTSQNITAFSRAIVRKSQGNSFQVTPINPYDIITFGIPINYISATDFDICDHFPNFSGAAVILNVTAAVYHVSAITTNPQLSIGMNSDSQAVASTTTITNAVGTYSFPINSGYPALSTNGMFVHIAQNAVGTTMDGRILVCATMAQDNMPPLPETF